MEHVNKIIWKTLPPLLQLCSHCCFCLFQCSHWLITANIVFIKAYTEFQFNTLLQTYQGRKKHELAGFLMCVCFMQQWFNDESPVNSIHKDIKLIQTVEGRYYDYSWKSKNASQTLFEAMQQSYGWDMILPRDSTKATVVNDFSPPERDLMSSTALS